MIHHRAQLWAGKLETVGAPRLDHRSINRGCHQGLLITCLHWPLCLNKWVNVPSFYRNHIKYSFPIWCRGEHCFLRVQFICISTCQIQSLSSHITLKRSILTHLPLDKMAAKFADDIFKYIFMHEKLFFSIRISLKFVPSGSIDNEPALVQVMAWRRTSDKPLSEPTLTQFTDAYMRHWGVGVGGWGVNHCIVAFISNTVVQLISHLNNRHKFLDIFLCYVVVSLWLIWWWLEKPFLSI